MLKWRLFWFRADYVDVQCTMTSIIIIIIINYCNAVKLLLYQHEELSLTHWKTFVDIFLVFVANLNNCKPVRPLWYRSTVHIIKKYVRQRGNSTRAYWSNYLIFYTMIEITSGRSYRVVQKVSHPFSAWNWKLCSAVAFYKRSINELVPKIIERPTSINFSRHIGLFFWKMWLLSVRILSRNLISMFNVGKRWHAYNWCNAIWSGKLTDAKTGSQLILPLV